MYSGVFLFLICLTGIYAEKKPIIETPYGKIRGNYLESSEGRTFSSFEGIPYAKPPVGNLRFSEPEPLESWNGIWEANITSYCIQIMHSSEPEGGNFMGEEDCLHLNVYAPKTAKTNLDVIVHIHSGGFMWGGAHNYVGPKYLMDRDVVLVTINYRLGPFGFLSTEDGVVPGNNGMKDQVAALRWIKDNIQYFGGNPNSVTITGLSAGGVSVHFHYLSPLSKGLFHKGISASGTSLCNWGLQESELAKTRRLATLVGCYYKKSSDIVNCLRQRPARQITEAIRDFRPWLMNPFSPFAVNIDRHSNNPFLPEHPYKLLAEGKVQDLPWLTSVTSDEGLYPAADFVVKEEYLPHLDKNWEYLAPYILHYDHTVLEKDQNDVSRKVKEYYLQDRVISRKVFTELVQMVGDRLFLVDAEKAARLQAKSNKSPVYFYFFNYHGEEMPSFVKLLAHYDSKYGVSHGDDIMYIFSGDSYLNKMSVQDKHMKNIFLDMYTSFARNGKPEVKNIKWNALDKDTDSKFRYLHIESPGKMVVKEVAEIGHRSFWDSLQFKENENLFPKLQTEL